jgi:AraC-like DNA-binding protein
LAKAFQSHLMDLLVNQITLELLRTESQSLRHFKNDKLVYAVRAVEENYLNPINLADLASVSGYSLDRFRHIFKEETGSSPLNFIFNKRLEHAQLLLRTTDQKISSIAMDCAFSTSSQFCTMFKKQFGITPEQFRRYNRGTI